MISTLIPTTFSPKSIGYMLIAGLVAVFLGFVARIQAENSRLEAEVAQTKQKAAALSDSLEKVAQYRGSDGTMRELWNRTLFPTTSPDTLGPDAVEGDVKSETNLSVDPEQEQAGGNQTAERSSADKYEYQLQPDTLDRYELRVDLTVFAPGNRIDYDVAVDALQFDLSLYQTENDEGIRSVAVETPAALAVSSVRGRVAEPPSPAGQDARNWQVDLPLRLTEGGIQTGARLRRYFTVYESPGVKVRGFAGAEGLVSLSGNTETSPAATTGLSLSF